MKKFWLVIFAFSFFLLTTKISGIELETENWQSRVKSFLLEESYNLDLWNHAGRIKISGWDKKAISIKATIYWHKREKEGEKLIDVNFDTKSDSLNVEPILPIKKYQYYYYPFLSKMDHLDTSLVKYKRINVIGDKDKNAFAGFIDYEINLPEKVKFKIVNLAGDIEIEKTIGKAEFDIGHSNLKYTEHSGELIIDSGSGDIHIRKSKGKIKVDTGSGNVSLSEIEAPQVEIDTGSGNVSCDYNDIKSEKIKIDTGSGDIHFKISPPRSAIIRLSTISGKINISQIQSQLLTITSDYVEIKIGEGESSGQIVLDTGSGDIIFEK